jgi:hypothetical protein
VFANVLTNDTDPDAGPLPLAIAAFTQPAWGEVMATNGGLLYTPPTNFAGVVAFAYTVSDGALTATGAAQVTILANLPPMLTALSNCVLTAGQTLRVLPAATDINVPTQALSFRLVEAPPGAGLEPTNGSVTWRPTLAQAPGAYAFQLAVDDNGTPPLSATQGFVATVNAPAQPQAGGSLKLQSGQFQFQIQGDVGPDYTILASSNLIHWVPLLTTNPATMPLWFTDPDTGGRGRRFYRTQLGP